MAENSLISTLQDGVRTLQFNRPKVRNALNYDMLIEIKRILNNDQTNNNVVMTVLTGVGDFYSSGNDFNTDSGEVDARMVNEEVEAFVGILIDYPKLLVAVVNGPAAGIAATTLALCDVVYCSDRATFSAPFASLGISPGCSSYTFPGILGRSKATEVLQLGLTMTAQEALQRGFVAKVIPHANLSVFVKSLDKFGRLPVNTVKNAKEVIIAAIKEKLHETNRREFDALRKMFSNGEFLKSLSAYLAKKSKL